MLLFFLNAPASSKCSRFFFILFNKINISMTAVQRARLPLQSWLWSLAEPVVSSPSSGYQTISKYSAGPSQPFTCLVGVKLVTGGGDNFCSGEVSSSIVLFSLPKSTNSLSPSRSVMADTIWVFRLSCWISCCWFSISFDSTLEIWFSWKFQFWNRDRNVRVKIKTSVKQTKNFFIGIRLLFPPILPVW